MSILRKNKQIDADPMKGLDAILFFPNYHAGIASSIQFSDTCCLGQQEKNGFAPAHCLLTPSLYHSLRKEAVYPFTEFSDTSNEFTTSFDMYDPIKGEVVQWKAFVQVIPYVDKLPFELGMNFQNSPEHKKVLKDYFIYHKKGVIENLSKKGYDLAILLGENPDKDKDFFSSTADG